MGSRNRGFKGSSKEDKGSSISKPRESLPSGSLGTLPVLSFSFLCFSCLPTILLNAAFKRRYLHGGVSEL